MEAIDRLMPGIRIEKNIDISTEGRGIEPSFQRVLDYLMQRGLLSPVSLELFRSLEGIIVLNLGETLKGGSLLLSPSFTTSLLQGDAIASVQVEVEKLMSSNRSPSARQTKQFSIPNTPQPQRLHYRKRRYLLYCSPTLSRNTFNSWNWHPEQSVSSLGHLIRRQSNGT